MSNSRKKVAFIAKKYLSQKEVASAISTLAPAQKSLLMSAFVKALLEHTNTMKTEISSAIKQKCHIRVEQLEYDDISYVRQDQVLKVIEES